MVLYEIADEYEETEDSAERYYALMETLRDTYYSRGGRLVGGRCTQVGLVREEVIRNLLYIIKHPEVLKMKGWERFAEQIREAENLVSPGATGATEPPIARRVISTEERAEATKRVLQQANVRVYHDQN
jgi:hypothetical protein